MEASGAAIYIHKRATIMLDFEAGKVVSYFSTSQSLNSYYRQYLIPGLRAGKTYEV